MRSNENIMFIYNYIIGKSSNKTNCLDGSKADSVTRKHTILTDGALANKWSN